MRLAKAELADRLIVLEQVYRELHNRWLEAQDKLLAFNLPKPPSNPRRGARVDCALFATIPLSEGA
jgi:hypothetical protein